MRCEVGTQAGIRPSKSLSPLESAQGILPVRRPRLSIVGRNLAVVLNEFSLQKPSVITCGFRAQEFSTPLARRRPSSYPPSLNMVLTHLTTVRAVTYLRLLWHHIKLSTSVPPTSRVPDPPSLSLFFSSHL